MVYSVQVNPGGPKSGEGKLGSPLAVEAKFSFDRNQKSKKVNGRRFKSV